MSIVLGFLLFLNLKVWGSAGELVYVGWPIHVEWVLDKELGIQLVEASVWNRSGSIFGLTVNGFICFSILLVVAVIWEFILRRIFPTHGEGRPRTPVAAQVVTTKDRNNDDATQGLTTKDRDEKDEEQTQQTDELKRQ